MASTRRRMLRFALLTLILNYNAVMAARVELNQSEDPDISAGMYVSLKYVRRPMHFAYIRTSIYIRVAFARA